MGRPVFCDTHCRMRCVTKEVCTHATSSATSSSTRSTLVITQIMRSPLRTSCRYRCFSTCKHGCAIALSCWGRHLENGWNNSELFYVLGALAQLCLQAAEQEHQHSSQDTDPHCWMGVHTYADAHLLHGESVNNHNNNTFFNVSAWRRLGEKSGKLTMYKQMFVHATSAGWNM